MHDKVRIHYLDAAGDEQVEDLDVARPAQESAPPVVILWPSESADASVSVLWTGILIEN